MLSINAELRVKLVMNFMNKNIKLCFLGGGRNVSYKIRFFSRVFRGYKILSDFKEIKESP